MIPAENAARNIIFVYKTVIFFIFCLKKYFLCFIVRWVKRDFLNTFEHKKMKKTRYIQRFTLIEMLVVVGIAGLLFALLGPAFTRMTQSNAVEQHASGLKLGMERARALAVSNRKNVALLLPYGETDSEKGVYKFQRGGFKYGYISVSSDGNYAFDGVVDDAEWKNRGNNAFLTAVDNAKNKNLSAEKPLDNFAKEPTGFNKLHAVSNVPASSDDGSEKISCRGIIFTPYGNVLIPGDDNEIYFYITGIDVDDHVKVRLNKLSGKVEYVE